MFDHVLAPTEEKIDRTAEKVDKFIHTIFSFVQSVFAMAGSLVNEFVHLLGGTINFLFCRCKHVIKHLLKMLRVCAANIIVIAGLVAAFFAYVLYTQRQAKPISTKKSS